MGNLGQVGDRVGFTHDGDDITGIIEKINQKTVSLVTDDAVRWRVYYHALYTVIDGQTHDPQCIEHQPESA